MPTPTSIIEVPRVDLPPTHAVSQEDWVAAHSLILGVERKRDVSPQSVTERCNWVGLTYWEQRQVHRRDLHLSCTEGVWVWRVCFPPTVARLRRRLLLWTRLLGRWKLLPA